MRLPQGLRGPHVQHRRRARQAVGEVVSPLPTRALLVLLHERQVAIVVDDELRRNHRPLLLCVRIQHVHVRLGIHREPSHLNRLVVKEREVELVALECGHRVLLPHTQRALICALSAVIVPAR